MKVFRWYGILIFGVIVLLTFVFFNFFFDKIIKNYLEKSLSLIITKPVEIKDFKSNIFSLNFEIDELQVIDDKNPKKNLVEVGKIKFNLSSNELSKKKYFIENLSIQNLRFNINRKVPYKNISTTLKTNTGSIKTVDEKKGKTERFNLLDKLEYPSVDEILKREKLKTIEVAKQKEKELIETVSRWRNKIKELQESKEELEILKKKIEILQNKSKNIKNLDDIKIILEQVKELKKQLNQKTTQIALLKKQLKEDLKKIEIAKNEIETAYKQDFNYLKEKYKFNYEGGLNFVELVFGEKIRDYLQKSLDFYKKVSPLLSRDEKEQKAIEEEKYRLEGNYIKYKEFNPLPNLVVKKSQISLKLFDTNLSGYALNFSDNQKLYRKPFELVLKGEKNKKFDNFSFYAKFDRTSEIAKDNISIKAKSVKISNLKFGKSFLLKDALFNINSNINIEDESAISGFIKLSFINTNFSSNGEKLLVKLLSNINDFYISVKLKGSLNNIKLSITSDLDDKLKDKLNTLIKDKSKEFEIALKNKLNSYKINNLKNLSSYKEQLSLLYKNINLEEIELKNLLNKLKNNFSQDILRKQLKGNIFKNFGF